MKKLLRVALIILLAIPCWAMPPSPPSSSTSINDSGTGPSDLLSAQKIYEQLALKQANLGLIAGTLTNGYICTYTASGTLLSCNTNPSSFQPVITSSTDLTAKSYKVTKQDGVAGVFCLNQANSTDEYGLCYSGPTGKTSAYNVTFIPPDAEPTANQLLLNSAPDGSHNVTQSYATYGQFGSLPVNTSSYVTGLMPSIVITTASGVHDGADDAATITDSGESFTTSQFVGMTLYNITDGSSCTVTANNGTTVTCTLAGGTDNNWDTNDVWQVGPGPLQSGSWIYVVAASTIRHPATAGYTVCYESDATAVLTVDMASDSMIFQGVLDTAVTALDAGDSIDSSGSTTGDFMCIHNKSATEAQGKGKRGTWVDGGAS